MKVENFAPLCCPGLTKAEKLKRERLRKRATSRKGDRAARQTWDRAPDADYYAADGKMVDGEVVDAYADAQLDAILGTETSGDSPSARETSSPPERRRSTGGGQERGLVIADVPGLIEDAHAGAGMGDAFLRHVERCAALVHVLDATADDPVADYETISRELELYSEVLATKPRVVVLNKIDSVSVDDEKRLVEALRAAAGHARVATASAATGKGVQELMTKVRKFCDAVPPPKSVVRATEDTVDLDPPFANSRDNPDASWTLADGRDTGFPGQWRLDSPRLEKVAAMTKFEQSDAVARFGRMLEALGVAQALVDRGAEKGDLVMVGDNIDLEYDPMGWATYVELKRNADDAADADAQDDDVQSDLDDLDGYGDDFLTFDGQDYGDDLDFQPFALTSAEAHYAFADDEDDHLP